MTPPSLTGAERAQVEEILAAYDQEKRDVLKAFLEALHGQLTASRALSDLIHSVKWRLKDPNHLRDKLIRKLDGAKKEGRPFDITRQNLFERINDLAGIRLLHLHTQQMRSIDKALRDIFEEYRYPLLEGPLARTWDDESRRYFTSIGIEVQDSPTSLYTSVHYLIEANIRTKYTCEIQVRTLAEELFGEVDHKINYPAKTDSVACREELLVLARVTSSCSRLVDAIFSSYEDDQARRRTDRPVWKKVLDLMRG